MTKNKLLFGAGLLLLAMAVLLSAMIILCDKEPPVITVAIPQRIAPAQPANITVRDAGSGLASVVLSATQPGAKPEIIVLEKHGSATEEHIKFCLAGDGAAEGELTIEVTAADKSLNRFLRGNQAVFSGTVYLDKTPPQPHFDHNPLDLTQGGTNLLRFAVSEDIAVASLASGDMNIPLFTLAPREYAALITLPYDADVVSFSPVLTLADAVGNTSRTPLPLHKESPVLRQDKIIVTEGLVNAKAQEFAPLYPDEKSALDLYLRVNNEERANNYKAIAQLCRQTAARPLWQGAFMPMPGAVRRSNFADLRSYTYKDQVVDFQVHLGLDFASIAKDKIPAANAGRVVCAEYIGIHGNMVIIDHGLGLHSLYSHLSEMHVRPGQQVHKGEIIGRTGVTGMAGGDHLHYEMLVNGISVDPMPWFNETWVEKNINSRLPQ